MDAKLTSYEKPIDFFALGALAEHAPFPIAAVEGDTHILRYANPALCKVFGRPADQIIGQPMAQLLPGEDLFLALLNDVSRTGTPQSFSEEELSSVHSVFRSYTIWPVLVDEQPVGLMIQVWETAELHRTMLAMNEALVIGGIREHEIKEEVELANARLQEEIAARQETARELGEKARLLDLTEDAIIVRGLDDRITLWNSGAEKLYGWTFKEVKGKHLHRLLRTEFPKPMEAILADLYRTGIFTGEVVQMARDGRRVTSVCRWVLDRATDSILTTYTDISERKRNEQALRESEERYRSLFNSIDEGFCVLEIIFDEHEKAIDFEFLEVNPSFEKQSGLHDGVGTRMRDLVPDHEDYWFETFGKVARSGEPVRFVNQAKALGERWFDAYAFRVGGAESRKVAVIFTDITPRKQNEIALEQARRQLSHHASNLEAEVAARTAALRDSVGSLETLTYTMAHDLRAPLRAMKGFTTALLEDVPLDETGKDYAQRIHVAAARMDQLVNDLLNYGELTHLPFAFGPIDLSQQVERALGELRREIEASHAIIQVNEPFPPTIGNEVLMHQVLCNLIFNALKFVRPGSIPEVRIHAESIGLMVRLWVEDNGIGIAPEYLQNIFGMFSRLHTTDEYPGTGVGLTIVKRAVERMGGVTGVESEPGKGSKFWIDLPGAS